MGSFYSNIQVKNSLGKEKFIEEFKNVLNSENSYRLAFSESWVAVVRPEYTDQPDLLESDTAALSKELKTFAFTTTVVDSDFALLTLFDNGVRTDEVVMGMADAYDLEEVPPDKDAWSPLLKSGADFNELSEIWAGDEVFCEDALYKSAPLFGIEPQFMTADHRSLDDETSITL